MKQIMAGLSAAAWLERSVRLEWKPQMFEVHTVKGTLLAGCRNVEGSKESEAVTAVSFVKGLGGREQDRGRLSISCSDEESVR